MAAHVLKPASLTVAAALMTGPCGAANSASPEAARRTSSISAPGGAPRDAVHLRVDGRVRDILAHPAFAGHAQLILPWDDRPADPDLPIRQIGSLPPYHTHVEPQVVVEGLNRMIDDATQGQQVFWRFYTPAQERADPTKANAGLFYFRGRPGAPFAIIAPGGGFAYVGSVHEGFPYAVEINRHGFNAFVLKYRAGQGGQAATEDLAAAVTFILKNAAELQVDPRHYSAWGSSAGARMVASIGSHGLQAFGGERLAKPATVVMAYTGHSDLFTQEPPTFAVVGDQDRIAPPAAMERRVAALRGAGSVVEYRKYAGVPHGFGIGTGTSAEGWMAAAIRFWERVIEQRGR